MAVTIRDVAKQAGVSVATVSRAINSSTRNQVREETRRKIFEIIKKCNYSPDQIARSLSTRRTKVLGLCMPFRASAFSSDYFTGVIIGAIESARKLGYELKIVLLSETTKGLDVSDVSKASAIDGALLVGTRIHDELVAVFEKSDIPWILVNNYSEGEEKANFVDCDNEKGAYNAASYLLGMGHRKIAFIKGPEDSRNANDRFAGYAKALKKNGIKPDKSLIKTGNFTEKEGYLAVRALLSDHSDITAIFCADDEMAVGALQAVKDKGLNCPKDISIIGFDDIRLSRYVDPPLTTVRQPIYEIGKLAAQMLIYIVEGKLQAPVSKILQTELIERSSCAPIAQK
ncbi:MAG: LacI family DNA-binding transcriptional regulator [Candidatus Aureabacteria bacterium]|nr:LacI family DNA-binding transcriptional regulator [Candidatus Auribacterota bacterium]